VLAYLVTVGAVVLLMMAFGLLLRLAQGGVITIPPARFYEVMTLHGAGMVGIAGLGGAAVMWHFLGQYVRLSTVVFVANLALFLIGVVMILASVLLGGFAGAWTFLYPLPAQSLGVWGPGAAALFVGGLLVIGTGFLLLYLDVARAILGHFGNLARALGWPQLFGHDDGRAPPVAVVASTMVLIVNSIGITTGAAILVMTLVNLYVPGFAVDPLLAKNMIYFFGHVFINATIYMAVIAVYEILPRYTGRPWKSNKVLLAAWTASVFMVMTNYPHHLLMDFAMPAWALIAGQVISYASGLPVLVVTVFGALTNVYRSGIRWDAASGLLLLATFGWGAGVIPAILDATVVVNQVMHNTLWVPGHFHTYLLLGMLSMVLGFMYFLGQGGRAPDAAGAVRGERGIDRLGFWAFALGGGGFVLAFLAGGQAGAPRRYAEHLAQWIPYDRVGALFGALVLAATLVFVARFLLRLRTARGLAA
jgi:cytochrome c oxidase subunit 1